MKPCGAFVWSSIRSAGYRLGAAHAMERINNSFRHYQRSFAYYIIGVTTNVVVWLPRFITRRRDT